MERRKKRAIRSVVCLVILGLAVAFVVAFRPTPLLPAPTGTAWSIDRVTLWTADGQAEDMADYDREALLTLLSRCKQQRVTGGVEKVDGVPQRPDWARAELLLSAGEESFLLLVGEELCQRRSPDYGAVVYTVTGGEDVDSQLLPALQKN